MEELAEEVEEVVEFDEGFRTIITLRKMPFRLLPELSLRHCTQALENKPCRKGSCIDASLDCETETSHCLQRARPVVCNASVFMRPVCMDEVESVCVQEQAQEEQERAGRVRWCNGDTRRVSRSGDSSGRQATQRSDSVLRHGDSHDRCRVLYGRWAKPASGG